MEQAVLYSLDNGFSESAVFLAEQLYYKDTTDSNARFLYGLCLYRASEINQAHFATRATKHLGCAYIYARTCLQLKKPKSGIDSLLAIQTSWLGSSNFYYHTESTRRLLPDSTAVHCLLGHLYKQNLDDKRAVEHYVHAIRGNPYLFEAFQGLLSLGVDMQIKNVFRASDVLSNARSKFESPDVEPKQDMFTAVHATPDIFNQPVKGNAPKNYSFRPTIPSMARLDETATPDGPATPTIGSQQQRSSLDLNPGTIQAPVRTKRKAKLPEPSAPAFNLHRGSMDAPNRARPRESLRDDSSSSLSTVTRRSSRLNLSNLSSLRLSPSKGKKTSKSFQDYTAQKTRAEPEIKPLANGKQTKAQPIVPSLLLPSREAEAELLRLLSKIGHAQYLLGKYQVPKSIEAFRALESHVVSAPSLLAKLARAYYENGNFEDAAQCYQDLRRSAPGQLYEMELYATCLWHLQKDVELSYLAHEALDIDPLSPQAWCILANCFSLKGEHDQALKCVRRAIQLDRSFAFAHTLEGHELVSSHQFDESQASFRNAIRADYRHYNAWYGLGMAYSKKKEYVKAEYHFKRAAQINPTNAVLACCIGIAQEHSEKWAEALEHFKLACQLSPNSSLARYRKAKALIMARDYKNAMNDLHILKELAPDEANVHYLLGKMYRQFGDKTSSMKHLTIAMNLDNKGNSTLRNTIEQMDSMDQSMERRY